MKLNDSKLAIGRSIFELRPPYLRGSRPRQSLDIPDFDLHHICHEPEGDGQTYFFGRGPKRRKKNCRNFKV